MIKILRFLNSKKSQKVFFIINTAMGFLCLKQIVWEGKEASVLHLTSIVILPFAYAYSLMTIIFITFFYQKNANLFFKILGIVLITLLLLYPFQLAINGTFRLLTLPFLIALIELFKDTNAIGKQVEMLVVTFILLFVAGIIAKILMIERGQSYLYGALYYFYLSYKDFRHIKFRYFFTAQ